MARSAKKALVPTKELRALGFSADEVGALGPRAAELSAILELARQAFGARAAQWLRSPEERLGNVSPVALLRDPHNGPNLVKQVLLNSLRGTL